MHPVPFGMFLYFILIFVFAPCPVWNVGPCSLIFVFAPRPVWNVGPCSAFALARSRVFHTVRSCPLQSISYRCAPIASPYLFIFLTRSSRLCEVLVLHGRRLDRRTDGRAWVPAPPWPLPCRPISKLLRNLIYSSNDSFNFLSFHYFGSFSTPFPVRFGSFLFTPFNSNCFSNFGFVEKFHHASGFYLQIQVPKFQILPSLFYFSLTFYIFVW